MSQNSYDYGTLNRLSSSVNSTELIFMCIHGKTVSYVIPGAKAICVSLLSFIAWSYPGKVQEREAKLDGTFQLWKWVQDRCEMSTISTPSALPYITTPPQLLIAIP